VSKRPIVLHSGALRSSCEPLLAAYHARHPGDEIEFHQAISTALDRRFRDEIAAAGASADVVWSPAMDLQMQLVRDGFAARVSPANAAALPAGAVHASCAFATTLEPVVTLVDARALGDAPAGSLREIADLLLSDVQRFRGRVAAYDIVGNGLGFLAMMFESRLRPGFDRFLEALAAVRPQLMAWNPPIVEALASANVLLAPHVLGHFADRAVAQHRGLAIARSDEPSIAISRIAFVSRHARNPEGALRLLDFLLGDEGQAKIGEGGLYPLRARRHDQARPLALVPLDGSFDALLDGAEREAFLARWRRAVRATADA
jgi:iron(III) transport system substrate-binding protein